MLGGRFSRGPRSCVGLLASAMGFTDYVVDVVGMKIGACVCRLSAL